LILRALKYSFAQAKVRALKSRLLTAEDWLLLLKRDNLGDFLQYLSGTEYSEALSHVPKGEPEPEVISLALHDDLFRDYAKLFRAVPVKGLSILKSLIARYEAENIKTVFRSLFRRKTLPEMRHFLYHLGPVSRLPLAEMLRAETPEHVVEHLRLTLFYRSLLHALPQWKAQGRIFPLEVAVDMAAFENLAAALRSLGTRDRKGAEILIGELIDFENLRWLARFRHYYDLPAEESINYMLSGGRRLGIRDLGALARSPNLGPFLEALPQPYRAAVKEARDWPEIQPLLDQWFLLRLYRVFRKDPFQIRLQISYLLLKEIEVKTLVSLASALSIGESPQEYVGLMSMPMPGEVRV